MTNKNILIIEDDFSVRENLKLLLEEEGYNTIVAENGVEGILKAKENKPHLIICDVMMPVCDGYSVIQELSKYEDTSTIPFLFLTAKIEVSDLRKGMELGADDYLLKPYKTAEILNAISTRLKKYEKFKSVVQRDKHKPNEKKNKRYSYDERIFISVNDVPKFIPINSIIAILSDNQYSNVYLENEKELLIRKSLKSWEESLPEKAFLRVHRGAIINLNYITRIEKWFNGTFKVYLKDLKEPVTVSKRYASKIKSNF